MADNAKVVAVLGRNRRLGRWRVAGHTLVVAVFGACEVDLTRALVDDDEDDVSLSIFSFLGSVTVRVRQGTDVQPSGIAVASSAVIEMHRESTDRGLRPLSMEWTTLFSRLRVTESESPSPPVGPTPARTTVPEHASDSGGGSEEVGDPDTEPSERASEPSEGEDVSLQDA